MVYTDTENLAYGHYIDPETGYGYSGAVSVSEMNSVAWISCDEC